jgi:tetratricopeptide (TPR) repeat protein
MKKVLLIIAIFTGICILSCGTKPSGPDDKETALLQGWNEFDDGFYEDAISAFENALKMDENDNNALCGLGWSYCRLDSFDTGIGYFEQSLEDFPDDYCSLTGISFAWAAVDSHALAVPPLTRVLAATDSAVVISETYSVRVDEMQGLLSTAYFLQNKIGKLNAQVDEMSPGHGIEPDDDVTWRSGNFAMNSYEDALLFEVLN